MKKILLLSLLVMFVSCTNEKSNISSESVVYICTGGYATKYHSSHSCSGLGNCRGDITSISIKDVEDRTPCKKCY